jgi:hypothetical protein
MKLIYSGFQSKFFVKTASESEFSEFLNNTLNFSQMRKVSAGKILFISGGFPKMVSLWRL